MAALDLNQILAIVTELLPVIEKYGVSLVDLIINAIKKDPSLDPAGLAAAIKARLDDAAAADAKVE